MCTLIYSLDLVINVTMLKGETLKDVIVMRLEHSRTDSGTTEKDLRECGHSLSSLLLGWEGHSISVWGAVTTGTILEAEGNPGKTLHLPQP